MRKQYNNSLIPYANVNVIRENRPSINESRRKLPFLNRLFNVPLSKKRELRDRISDFEVYLRQLEHGGYKTIEFINNRPYYCTGEKVVGDMINILFPYCHDLTKKYILSGYVLDEEWEKEILGFLKDDRVNVLSNELIFILFSTKIPVEDFLELSKLPISYLAKLLPVKEDA
jgi:hypothetical protein